MERAQLFKRLLAITEDEIASLIKHDDDISRSLLRLDLAARTRHIIDVIQLEDMWQQLDEASQTFNIHIAMKLSPMTLCAGLQSDMDMNCLEWRLVLPKYADISDELKPTRTLDYLAMAKHLNVVDIERYDVKQTCAYLEQVYDFTVHKKEQRRPFNFSIE